MKNEEEESIVIPVIALAVLVFLIIESCTK